MQSFVFLFPNLTFVQHFTFCKPFKWGLPFHWFTEIHKLTWTPKKLRSGLPVELLPARLPQSEARGKQEKVRTPSYLTVLLKESAVKKTDTDQKKNQKPKPPKNPGNFAQIIYFVLELDGEKVVLLTLQHCEVLSLESVRISSPSTSSHTRP